MLWIRKTLKFIILFIVITLLSGCRFFTQLSKSELIVSINFDDNCGSVYENALPIMQQYGFRATNFVNSGRVGNVGRMSWSQLDELTNLYKWEIGGHSLNHEYLADLTYEQAENVIKADYDSLLSHGYDLHSFSTPFGYCPINYYSIIQKYYRNVRTCFDNSMHNPVDRSLIGCIAISKDRTPQKIIDRIFQARIERENLVVLLFHDITSGDADYSSSYNLDDFAEVMQRLNELGVKVLPLDEALNDLEN